MKAVKFGGTSMSSADSILKAADIIASDADRRFVVVSAPGKAKGEDKVTDMLIAAADAGVGRVGAFKPVRERFERICAGVGLGGEFLRKEFCAIEAALPTADKDYIISRGEYLCAKVLAKVLDFEFVDATEIISFDGSTYDDDCTEHKSRAALAGSRCAVIPGFYGGNERGEIVTFSRGGSDISGAIVARAVNADVYENYTDVDGFMTCDPKIVPHASIIDLLTYNELRELSYMGANVLHPEAIFPVRRANIPIHIRNTFNENAIGTRIVPTEEFLSGRYSRKNNMPITGIAGKPHFCSLHIEKSMMNGEIGFLRRVLNCFERYGVSVEHVPTGIDNMTVVFSPVDGNTLDALIDAVEYEVKPDRMSLKTDVALIAIVGHAMKSRPGAVARAINRLSNAGINIRMLDLGASEINLILGVSDADFERALIALNGEFEV